MEKNLFNAELFKRLEELNPRYFDTTDRKQKEKFKHEIGNLIHELTNGKEAFDFEIYFSEVMDKKRRGGFDTVIGNPPMSGRNPSRNSSPRARPRAMSALPVRRICLSISLSAACAYFIPQDRRLTFRTTVF